MTRGTVSTGREAYLMLRWVEALGVGALVKERYKLIDFC